MSGFAHQDALRQKQQQAALKQQLEFERCSSVTSSLDPMGMDRERQLSAESFGSLGGGRNSNNSSFSMEGSDPSRRRGGLKQ